jgi:hypothetical protein
MFIPTVRVLQSYRSICIYSQNIDKHKIHKKIDWQNAHLITGQSGNGDSSGDRNNRWDMSPLPGPRPMPILPRPATAYSDFQPYSSPIPCPSAARTNAPAANMLTVRNQSGPQAIKASRPPTSLPLETSYPVAVLPTQQQATPLSTTTCIHSKLGPTAAVPAAQPVTTGKQVLGNNSVLLGHNEPQQDPKNNNVLLLQTKS